MLIHLSGRKKTAQMKTIKSSLLLLLLLSNVLFAADVEHKWQDIISGNNLIIMRHAIAPGTGDPRNFELGNCETQRNLSSTGRQQAKSIGERFKQAGIRNAQVYSSQWCRCVDTAVEMEIGTVKELPFLNSFFEQRELEAEQMRDLRAWLQTLNADEATILVTHQVVITSLTGVYPASGEAVVIKLNDDGEVEVVNTIPPD